MFFTFAAKQDWFFVITDQVINRGRTGQLNPEDNLNMSNMIETERNVISYIVMMTIEN